MSRSFAYWAYKRLAKSNLDSVLRRKQMLALRALLAKGMLDYSGETITVEHGAKFGYGFGIRLGNRSGLGVNCHVTPPTTIGDNVLMGPDVMIITSNHRFSRRDIPIIEQGGTAANPVTIGDDVWIGARVILLPGTTIGRGCVIGAGSVVRGEIPEWSIVMGNPAQVVGIREDRR